MNPSEYSTNCSQANPTAFPQNEDTPIRPTCAYGISKSAGMGICAYYRSARNIFAVSGILYNHESPLRPATHD